MDGKKVVLRHDDDNEMLYTENCFVLIALSGCIRDWGGCAHKAESISASEQGVRDIFGNVSSLYDDIIMLAVLRHASARVWFPKSTVTSQSI